MKKLLHIVATPRAEESRTLQVSEAFLNTFRDTHADWVIEELDLSKEELPSLTMKRIDGKHILLEGKDLFGEFKEAWEAIIVHIEKFLSADAYLISVPMWNFCIPYMLKHYLDVILQPKYLFRYTTTGVEGLVVGKKMVVIASRGGEYLSEPMKKLDFQEPYLRSAFGFVGITDIEFIIAQPMDMGQEIQQTRIKEARDQARKLATRF
jgi:FMN-dependent NADH-azoreductase